MLKSANDTLDIRFDNYLSEKSWILSSKKKIDILPIEIDDQPTKVTFISAVDSISFTVKLGDRYDFIISRGKKNYHTRVEGRQALMTKKDDSLATVNLQCLKTNLLSTEQRNKQYPFNKAKRIELISFTDTASDFTIALPVKHYRLERSKIRDQKVLDTAQVNALTDIWFNIGRTPINNLKYISISRSGCYEPRNGIVFIDEKNRVFEYVEICFACKGNRYSSKRIKPWDDCEQKYMILRDYFAKQGVKFGVEEH
ncbi:hypothetical protein [Pedobacter miscanthi]|uniref:hypothetical protein n=1 Tax=Pedobacter miscanthi TaxID=2259170 RepID=UPI001314BD2F|nr:hypothetical protein [Pedobacter miscanthi]